MPRAAAPTTAAAPATRGIDPLRLARLARRLTLPLALVAGIAFFACFGAVRVPPGMDTLPSIPPGSLCIVDKRGGAAQVGDEVFVDLPLGGTLLTRVQAIDAEGRLVVQNDRQESQLPDSDQFGPLPRSAVRGVVITTLYSGQGETGEPIRGR